MPLPDPDSLRCFIAAAKQLNFKDASKEVGLTAAAFGQRIKTLEDLIGKKLFHRSTRKVELSEFAVGLLPHAEKAIEALNRCLQPENPGRTVLRIGTRYELGLSWLQPSLNKLQSDSTYDFDFHLDFADAPILLAKLQSQQLDAVVCSYPLNDPQFDYENIHNEHYALVSSPNLLKKAPLRSKAEAAHHKLIDISPSLSLFHYWNEIHSKFLDSTHFRSLSYRGTIASIRDDVLAGKGVAVLPRYFIEKDLKKKKLITLFPKKKLAQDSFRLVFLRQIPLAAFLRRLAGSLQKFPLR